MIGFPKLVLAKLVKGRTGDELEGIGRQAARENFKPAAEFVMKEFTIASCIEVLRRMSAYGERFIFEFGEGKDSRKHVIALRHDQGELWSRYYVGLLDEIFRILLGEEGVKITHTDSLCILQMASR
jgi:hypothetical protein